MSEVLLRTRRAPTACSWCRYRKVRCDASILGCPCTRCRQDGRSNCVLRPHFRQCVYPVVALWSRILTVAPKEGSPRQFPVRVDFPVQAMENNTPIQIRTLAQNHPIIEKAVWWKSKNLLSTGLSIRISCRLSPRKMSPSCPRKVHKRCQINNQSMSSSVSISSVSIQMSRWWMRQSFGAYIKTALGPIKYLYLSSKQFYSLAVL